MLDNSYERPEATCQISPDWTGVRSVNINLLKDRELDSVLIEGNVSYLLGLAWFLATELVTGKS